jgi:hypothetical protein
MIKQEYCLGKEPPYKPSVASGMDEGINIIRQPKSTITSYNYDSEYDGAIGLEMQTIANIKNNKLISITQDYILQSKRYAVTDKQFIAIIDRISKQHGKPKKVTNKGFYSYAEWKNKKVGITVNLNYEYITVIFESLNSTTLKQ